MEIANLSLQNLRRKKYYNLPSIEREIDNYSRAIGVAYRKTIVVADQQFVYRCAYSKKMKCKASIAVTIRNGDRPFEITIYERHTHNYKFEPAELDPSPYDIDPSKLQEEPVQMTERMRAKRRYFRRMLDLITLRKKRASVEHYRQIFIQLLTGNSACIMEIANLSLQNLRRKKYYNLPSIEREIDNYSRAIGVAYRKTIVVADQQFVYRCAYSKKMKCKASIAVTIRNGDRPFEITIYERHTHNYKFEPAELDPSPYDIDPSKLQEEPVQMTERMRAKRRYFRRMLDLITLRKKRASVEHYRQIFIQLCVFTFCYENI
ncbi:unnamed protein product [Rodentolepis nana]|uniref:FLYWCH-type domain-containing protein n=1 Tax=Rodentolepis nana TaxID=102285 RepID=A0A0R3TZS2_RODNA|nr:unnamed protein product [Rodentolepis nana]